MSRTSDALRVGRSLLERDAEVITDIGRLRFSPLMMW
jgi:hypothetical protein